MRIQSNNQAPTSGVSQGAAADQVSDQKSQPAASGETTESTQPGKSSAAEAASKKSELGLAGQAQAAALNAKTRSEKMDEQSGIYYPTLRNGSRGPEVLELQKRLNESGTGPKIPEDGVFTDDTARALLEYQSERGLKADGIAGPETLRSFSNPEKFGKMKLHSKGPAVAELQKFLNLQRKADGLPEIKEDGSYGPKTEQAVREYQEMRGLKKDGVVGQDTMNEIKKEGQWYTDDGDRIVPPPHTPTYELPSERLSPGKPLPESDLQEMEKAVEDLGDDSDHRLK